MKLETPFIELGRVDVGNIKAALSTLPDSMWYKNTFRQNNYTDHAETRSIVFEWSSNSNEMHDKSYIDYDNQESLIGKMVYGIVNTLQEYSSKRISKCMLVMLPSKTNILPHSDIGPLLELVHRVHVPIITNERCIFYIEGVGYNFKEGIVVEIDNTRMHSVENAGTTDRVHLIVDFFSEETNGN